MEGKKKKYKRKNSSVKSRKKIKRSSLSNEELLDQIITKKSKKKKGIKLVEETQPEIEIPEYSKQYVDERLREINKLIKAKKVSNDELYDLLQERKELNKYKRKYKVFEEKKEPETIPETTPEVEVVEEKKIEVKEEVKPEEEPVFKEKASINDLKKVRNQNIVIIIILLALLIGLIMGITLFVMRNKEDPSSHLLVVEENNEEELKEDKEKELAELYEKCLVRPLDDKDRTEDVIKAEDDLKSYLSKYKTSVGYVDLDYGYTFNYNENQVYYAASTTKILVVLYLYKEAANGNVDLEKTIKYTSSDRWSASPEMSKVKYGTNVSLRTLSKYTLTVSDNTAYQMLVKYVGRKKIIEFARSLGAKHTFTGDNFGSIDVNDGINYWKAVNEFINNSGDLGEELKGYMVAAEQNGLSFDQNGIQAAHKYGEYSPIYHDLGIVYSSHPYIVVILTREYGKTMLNKIQDINSKIYELHLKYYTNRENVCHLEVYGS